MLCLKSVQIRSFFWSVFSPNTGKYGPEKNPYLNIFHCENSKTKVRKIICKQTKKLDEVSTWPNVQKQPFADVSQNTRS